MTDYKVGDEILGKNVKDCFGMQLIDRYAFEMTVVTEKEWDILPNPEKYTLGKDYAYCERNDTGTAIVCASDEEIEILALPPSQQFVIGNEYAVGDLPVGATFQTDISHQEIRISREEYESKDREFDRDYPGLHRELTTEGHVDAYFYDKVGTLISLPTESTEEPTETDELLDKIEADIEAGNIINDDNEVEYSKRHLNIHEDSEEWFNEFLGGRKGKSGPLRSDQEIVRESLIPCTDCNEGTFSIPSDALAQWLMDNVEGFPEKIFLLAADVKLKVGSPEFGMDGGEYQIIEENGKLKVKGM